MPKTVNILKKISMEKKRKKNNLNQTKKHNIPTAKHKDQKHIFDVLSNKIIRIKNKLNHYIRLFLHFSKYSHPSMFSFRFIVLNF